MDTRIGGRVMRARTLQAAIFEGEAQDVYISRKNLLRAVRVGAESGASTLLFGTDLQ